jgi:hydrogenase expression/formation protein HypC
MCLAIPAKVLKIRGGEATVDFGGVKRRVMLTLLPEVRKGDYVLVHTGFAIEVLDENEAKETLRLWREVLSTEYLHPSG